MKVEGIPSQEQRLEESERTVDGFGHSLRPSSPELEVFQYLYPSLSEIAP